MIIEREPNESLLRLFEEEPNAKVNRRQCEALTSELNLQLGFHPPLRGHCAKETCVVDVARWEAAPPKTGQSMARNARQLGWSRVTSLALVNRCESISRLPD